MKFPDVKDDAWYAKYVNAMADIGVFIGDEKGNFRPNDPLTRAEAAAMVYRVFEVLKNKIGEGL